MAASPVCHREGCNQDLPPNARRWCSETCRSKARDRGKVKVGLAPGLQKVADLLANAGIDPEAVGKVEKVKLSEWEGFSKDEDGNAVVTPLTGTSVVLSPKWADGPTWPVVQPAAPVTIKPVAAKRKRGKWRSCVVLPDPQIGYRQLANGDLDPFHDEKAMSVAMRIVAQVQPDLIINLGDLLDFAAHGRYAQEAGFARTTQPTLDRAHRFLAEQRATSPHAEIRLLEGNHDIRLATSIQTNALAAFGLQRANLPESWPVMSVPHLLRLDELGVEYVGGYPNGRTWINDRLACSHAPTKLRSSGSSAAASIDDERVSVLVGHTHRIELQHKTRNVRGGARQNLIASLGCLCRTDGAVPSTKSSLDVMGRPVRHYEDWQHAVGVVSYQPGDGPFGLEIVPIIEGQAIFRGEAA